MFASRSQSTVISRGRIAAAALCALTVVSACGGDDDNNDLTGPGESVPRGASIFGVDNRNTLVVFGRQNPTREEARRIPITGLQAGDTVVGIDFRANAAAAADKRLYAITSGSRVYAVDTTSGAATAVSSAAFTPPLRGTAFGVDFNPRADLLRLHSNQEQNLRINQRVNPVTVTDDSVLAYEVGDMNVGQNPNIVGTAYSNSVSDPTAAATATELFAIDSDRDVLVFLQNPNFGRLRTRGALGVDTDQNVGFDIFGAGLGGATGPAFATLTTQGQSRSKLYTINLTTGAATPVGDVNYNRPLISIAAAP